MEMAQYVMSILIFSSGVLVLPDDERCSVVRNVEMFSKERNRNAVESSRVESSESSRVG